MNGPRFVVTMYIFPLCVSPRTSQGSRSKVRLTSPCTSLMVISEYSPVESRHLAQTLGILEFYNSTMVLSLVPGRI